MIKTGAKSTAGKEITAVTRKKGLAEIKQEQDANTLHQVLGESCRQKQNANQ